MKTKISNPEKFSLEFEADGGEFSVLNSQQYFNYYPTRGYQKSTLQTNILYVLSILTITSWIISLTVFPFGDVFQFLLGGIVLLVNGFIFKYN
jgi:hypothetical protein